MHRTQGLSAYQSLLLAELERWLCCLQITLFHQEACEAVDEDSLLELCDWAYRKLLSLNTKHHKQNSTQSEP